MNQHSIFSNYLVSLLNQSGTLSNAKLSNIHDFYNQLRIAYNQGAKVLLDMLCIILPFTENGDYDSDFLDYEDLYFLIHNNKSLNDWLHYVNRVITFKFGELSAETLYVRVRIATNMLDKVEIPANVKWKICYNLRENVWNETRLLTDESLPF